MLDVRKDVGRHTAKMEDSPKEKDNLKIEDNLKKEWLDM